MRANILITAFLVINTITIYAQKYHDIAGIWVTPQKDSKIKMAESNGTYIGSIVWLKVPNDKNGNSLCDGHNPDKSLRTRTIIGLNIISVKATGNANIYEGSIYDAESGKTYKVRVIAEVDELEIVIPNSVMDYSETWTR